MAVFFISWALWEEMTFVLACCIVIVFCLGIFKLWWATRVSKKQEIVAEEKRARIEEMRKTGMKIKRSTHSDIPFGVRALQSGVEVEGIWIAQKPTLSIDGTNGPRAASSATMSPRDSETGSLIPKIKSVGDEFQPSSPTAEHSRPSTFRNSSRMETAESSPPLSPSHAQFGRAKSPSSLHPPVGTVLNEDTLRRLEGRSSPFRQPAFDSDIPSAPYAPGLQSTSGENKRPEGYASSVDSVSSFASSGPQSQGRSLASSTGKDSRTSRPQNTSRSVADGKRPDYSTLSRALEEKALEAAYDAAHGPVTLGPTGPRSSPPRHATTASPGPSSLARPEPTFGPHDMNANRAGRRVNSGFEVLPAGTFSQPAAEYPASSSGGSGANVDLERGIIDGEGRPVDTSRFTRKQPNKLRKNSPPRPGEASRSQK